MVATGGAPTPPPRAAGQLHSPDAVGTAGRRLRRSQGRWQDGSTAGRDGARGWPLTESFHAPERPVASSRAVIAPHLPDQL